VSEVPGTRPLPAVLLASFGWTQCQESCPTTTWCFPLSPESHAKSHPDPASKVDEHARRFAEAEIAAPAPHVWASSSIVVSMLTPFARRVISRIVA